MVRDGGRAAEALGSFEVGVERGGVGFATDDAGARASLFVAPAHPPDRAAGALDLLDAHCACTWAVVPAALAASAWTSARKLPAAAARGARSAARSGVLGRAAVWRCEAIQALKSSGVIRIRERSLTAGSSPSVIARRTAVSDSLHAAATSLIVRSTSLAVAATVRPAGAGAVTRNDVGIAEVVKVCVTVISASLIREARMRAGLSQAQLAERCGKSKVQIGRWETGTVAPSIDTLLEIVRSCGFDLPLMLETYRKIDDRELTKLQRYSPERRVHPMLDRITTETQ